MLQQNLLVQQNTNVGNWAHTQSSDPTLTCYLAAFQICNFEVGPWREMTTCSMRWHHKNFTYCLSLARPWQLFPDELFSLLLFLLVLLCTTEAKFAQVRRHARPLPWMNYSCRAPSRHVVMNWRDFRLRASYLTSSWCESVYQARNLLQNPNSELSLTERRQLHFSKFPRK